ncbi:MAG: sporulation protein [Thaumarchaeota archaeon]|nr:sporulation protein [Nitrososphaerota archaeon]MCL5317647.1 sporulation protein [Nitrososphaerota archaeon]
MRFNNLVLLVGLFAKIDMFGVPSLFEVVVVSGEEQIRTTVEELLKVLSTNNVIGERIELEDKTLIPVTRIGMGFGAGTGEGTGTKGEGGKGGGAGGGAGVEPVGLIVVFKGVRGPDGVKVLPLSVPGPLAKTVGELTSAVVEKLREKKGREEEGEEERGAAAEKKKGEK